MVRQFLKKYNLPILAFGSLLLFVIYYSSLHSTAYESQVAKFQREFQKLESRLDAALEDHKVRLGNEGLAHEWRSLSENQQLAIHIYKKDSLVFWSTNQLPILRFAEIHYPAEGLVHLQNGWYFARITRMDDYLICGSFLVKSDYPYENRDLVNSFSSDLAPNFAADVVMEQESGYPVLDAQGNFVLSLKPHEKVKHTKREIFISSGLLLLSIGLFFYFLLSLAKKKREWKWAFIPILVVLLRWLSLKFEWFGFLSDLEIADPALFGTNEIFPNFLELLINIEVIAYLVAALINLFGNIKKWRFGKQTLVLLYFLSPLAWWFLIYFSKVLIENSSIPLVIDKLFSLNLYSLFAVAGLGVLYFSYHRLVRNLLSALKDLNVRPTFLAVSTFLFCFIFFVVEINTGHGLFVAGLFPFLLYGILFFLTYRRKKQEMQLGAGLIILMLFAFVTAANLGEFNKRKDRSERELFANQLATEKSISTEAEFASMSSKIDEDNLLKKLIVQPKTVTVSDFQESMERRLFNGYWERYEMGFSLFDENYKLLIDDRNDYGALYATLQSIIDHSGEPSEMDSNIFFIRDYVDQYSYIIRKEIYAKDSTKATLFCTLKSKKIPEEIGFPRLLISQRANVIESLESYSIAKFHAGKLVAHYGRFDYPSTYFAMTPKRVIQSREGYFDYGEYNHFMLIKGGRDAVVLSIKNPVAIDLITSFSYLFSFFGLLLFPAFFQLNRNKNFRRTFTLAMKIQIVLISLVFVSLFAFGWGSGVFVSNQYNRYTDDVIREKLSSVQTEVRSKLGDFNRLTIDENGSYVEYILQKFAKVFFTDINLYDNNGYLLGTSRSKVFNSGLLSEQMNPVALREMKYRQKSEFVHDENIGLLNYASAYLPFYNNDGQQMGFINLQHFGQQRELENQIQRFLVSIINVFILLLVISIVMAILISNWLTTPLRLLQENFAAVRFGKQNQQISYDKEDEIGALVKDYNQKLMELEFAANQLAKSERESAWREMAKQVAHEIKNPLTPMKLTVQQLLRTYDPQDPKSGEKLNKVANSIIEQIDALTRIANEFSNFAKMPNPSEEKLNIVTLAKSVAEVFSEEERAQVIVESSDPEICIMADKNQFLRVFNNLIKNGIQAIPADREGKILISIQKEGKEVIIRVSDNGVGIDSSQQSKLFVPYFTTKSTGTGLGLAMVKQIIENHHGAIDFESILGEGTTFEIIVPVIES